MMSVASLAFSRLSETLGIAPHPGGVTLVRFDSR